MPSVIGTNLTITKDGTRVIQKNDAATGGVTYEDVLSLTINLAKGQNYTLPLSAYDNGKTRVVIAANAPVQIILWPAGFNLANLSTTTTTTTTQDPGAAASGTVTLAGTITANDIVSVTLAGTEVSYTVLGTEADLAEVATALVAAINQEAALSAEYVASAAGAVITLTARYPGVLGNVALSTSVSVGATLTATASGAALTGGENLGAANPYPSAPVMPLMDLEVAADTVLDVTLKQRMEAIQIIAPNGANDVAPELTLLVGSQTP